MSIASTSSSQTINALLTGGRAAGRLLPAPANSEQPVSATRQTSRVLPDPRQQAPIGDKTHGRSNADNGVTQSTPRANKGANQTAPSGFLSAETLLTAQILGQPAQIEARPGLSGHEQSIKGHRDAAALGTRQYRLAGAQPEILSDRATFLSLAI